MQDLKNLYWNKTSHFVDLKDQNLAVQKNLQIFRPFRGYKYVSLAEDHQDHNVNKENYPGH